MQFKRYIVGISRIYIIHDSLVIDILASRQLATRTRRVTSELFHPRDCELRSILSTQKPRSGNIIFISGVFTRVLHAPRASRIVKYVNTLFTRARRALNPGAQKEREYLRNRHTREQRTSFTSAFRTGREWSPQIFMRLSLRSRRSRDCLAKTLRRERKIQSPRAADLCLPRDPDAIKSDISGGAIYRDSAKSAATSRPDKNRVLSLVSTRRCGGLSRSTTVSNPSRYILFCLVSITDMRRYRARGKSENFYNEFIFIKHMKQYYIGRL